MLSKKLFISLFLSFISLLVFGNTTYAVYNVDSSKINQLLDRGYFISAAYRSEQLCKDNIRNYSNTASYYDRSECFRSENKFYYLKCEKNARCDLNYLFNLNNTNTNVNHNYNKPKPSNPNINNPSFNGNNSNNISTNNITKLYLYRTFNNKTGKYYLKYSTNSSANSVITHDGEYVDSVYVLSSKNVSGTTAVYLGGDGADGYITYNPTSKLIGYAGNNSDNGKIALYNCFKGQDFFITTDSACNGYKRYNNSVFYVYPAKIDNSNSNNNNNYNNINGTVTADSYITDDNELTIIANTELNRNNISFCVIGKECVKLTSKWQEFKVGNTNKRAGYKITIMGIPAGVYEGYFKYVSADGILRKSNNFRQVIKITVDGNLTLISKQKIKAFFSIPEGFTPKFFINYNGGEYNLIDEGWNITRNNGLLNYTQNLSLFIRGVYDAYVTYGNNRIEFNSVSVK